VAPRGDAVGVVDARIIEAVCPEERIINVSPALSS
jgi:hypothetical protein